ncbi:hypothetical protein AKG11_11665 [Shinella sp. SUS2]|jgi:hypothetical protein|uniref:DUF4864 domain-containing protein n=1 Tax=unclassified Shinella TaxID=2643062 RepID=UPI0003C54FB7|nr:MULTISPECIES: DUF4864 domain-containing protein [unclassified Shinella]MCA0345056.1 DUF4864 domain-containing protein [Pseudomonadota bacterium]EYR79900.1 hypothetical protein SHLA_1c000780 [Shinella sp. DD12]KNY16964.1 hypothetical protein AKG11_11665 [Shinella sp. SUS2]KOC73888.1 hypothetical protein AKG10_20115 [Shinella sp. GWS1]MDG4670974.1 DUF4864 domain-containing protein [Shinella sp. 838]
MKMLAAVFLCVSLSLPSATWAGEPVDTVQGIIQSQIAAFLDDDAKAAYSFASPTIRGKFPTEDAFFDMVKKGYAPVYRPGNFAFGRSKVTDGVVVQEVLISGPDGKDWTALYQVVKQPDGSYKINGVHIVRTAPGPEI